MTTPLRYLKPGRPIDALILNEFWNRVWLRLVQLKGFEGLDYACGRMYHTSATVLAGNALTGSPISNLNQYPYDSFVRQSAAALNDEFKNSCYIPPGTYELRVMGDAGTAMGIVSWYINDTLVGTQDWYSASDSDTPVVKTLTGIWLPGGWTTVKGKVTNKNASSSGYQLPLNKYSLVLNPVGNLRLLEFWLDDNFTTDDAAPITNPRIAEPGGQSITVSQILANFSISGGKLNYVSPSTHFRENYQLVAPNAGPGPQTGSITGIKNANVSVNLGGGPGLVFGLLAARLAFQGVSRHMQINDGTGNYSTMYAEVTLNTNYHFAIALTASGGLLYFYNTKWRCVFASLTSFTATAPILHNANGADSAVGTVDMWRGANIPPALVAPVDTISGNATAGSALATTSDEILFAFTLTRPSSGEIVLKFRDTGSDYLRLRISATQFLLDEVVAGVPTNIATGGVADGLTEILIYDTNKFRVCQALANGSPRIDTVSTLNVGTTGVEINALGTGGVIANPSVWHHSVTGDLRDYLNALLDL
jgi:hypothetical protein